MMSLVELENGPLNDPIWKEWILKIGVINAGEQIKCTLVGRQGMKITAGTGHHDSYHLYVSQRRRPVNIESVQQMIGTSVLHLLNEVWWNDEVTGQKIF